MRPGADFLKFLVVSVLGLGLDLSVAWALATFAGVPLPAAAFCGFAAGAVLNYGLHEVWTFASKDRKPSAKRGGLYLLTLGAVVGVRVATVAALEATLFPAKDQALIVLVLATGVSFVVNYLLSKYVVFRPGRASPEQS